MDATGPPEEDKSICSFEILLLVFYRCDQVQKNTV
jgi:hypothetical protein